MAKKIDILSDLTKKETTLKNGRSYQRDILVDEAWTPGSSEKALFAFSKILEEEEVLVVMNLGNEETETWVNVDYELNPAGSKMQDLLKKKSHLVAETNGRNSVKIKLKPNHMAILKNKK